MDTFIYDAPVFFDFAKDLASEDAKNAEAFFEIEHEKHNSLLPEPNSHMSIEGNEREPEQEFYTPLKLTPRPTDTDKSLRRSISMIELTTGSADAATADDVDTISNAMETLQVGGYKKRSVRLTVVNSTRSTKSHRMSTRADIPKLHLRSRSISRDQIEKLAPAKRKNISYEDLTAKKFVSMAEAVNQFQQKTPKRFHSKSKVDPVSTMKLNGPIPNTIPHSPALATKQRARPTQILSREESEFQEYQAAQKFKIKANPVNPKILQGPVQFKAHEPRPPTKPEPFNLTQVAVRKAPTSPKAEIFAFHANPVPKSVLEAPKPIIKSSLCTIPHTPKLMKRYTQVKNETVTENTSSRSRPFKLTATKPKPFSFDERDKDVVRRREKLINEALEEERKAREFHARPLPKSIFRSPQAKNNSTIFHTQRRQRSDGSMYKSAESMSEVPVFKARPARVLQMKPFEPKKEDRHLTEISEFQLNTVRRAKERDYFEQQKKEKEERLAQMIKENQDEILRHEQEEAARIRKAAEYKAQPIRRYKDVKPVAAKKLTDPVSPKFAALKKTSNKENAMKHSEEL